MVKVCKFGGTSVATAAQLRKVAAIVAADDARRVWYLRRRARRIRMIPKRLICSIWRTIWRRISKTSAPWEQIAGRFQGIISELGLEVDLAPALDEARAAIETALRLNMRAEVRPARPRRGNCWAGLTLTRLR